MIIPIRCFTCGKVIGNYWEEYKERTKNGEEPKKVLNDLEIDRYCCRRIFLSHQDLSEEISPYY